MVGEGYPMEQDTFFAMKKKLKEVCAILAWLIHRFSPISAGKKLDFSNVAMFGSWV
jgi:hypothetical protein